ncbi:MAG: hypothetical protein Q4F84_03675, partial [Fibrobacter sp.]|nr:hypothetical protein [Fibrobacter sp.]
EILENWEITGAWTDTVNGYYWCKINMDKNAYYNRINKKVIDCKTLATDALVAAESGSFTKRLTELCNALKIIDDYFGIPLKVFYRGDSVVLNNEIPRRINLLFSAITIKPNVNKLVLGSQEPIPDTICCSVFFNDQPETSASVKWVSSSVAINVSSVPGSFENNHYVKIGSVPPSRDPVTITATLNAGTNAARLVQTGIKIPSGSFTVLRKKASLRPVMTDPFTMEIVNRLVSESVVEIAKDNETSDFIFEVFCEPYGEPALMMGLHKATALVNVKLESSQGETVTEFETTVSSNHP